ncbi:MAG: hypothetical protein HYX89_03900 [Chloroflexi bacterium]|nr:hypothetical protein [Chloroflexota bacterium]
MQEPNEEQQHIQWLRDKLAETERELVVAEATVARLRPVVINMRATLDALSGETRYSTFKAASALSTRESRSGMVDAASFVFESGTKARRMPLHRPEYAGMTNVQAARAVLEARGPLHVDDITKAVFIIENRDGFLVGKRNLTTELIRGARKGMFEFLGKNRFAPVNSTIGQKTESPENNGEGLG